VHVRLVRKYCTSLNGVDLSHVTVGDVISLPDKTALMLVQEGWAERLIGRLPESQPDENPRLR
jgi:hypothetical protein